MKFKHTKNTIGSTPDQYLGIDPEEANKIATLLIQKYKSRVTPIREIVVNALETTDNAVANGREFRPVELGFEINKINDADAEGVVSPFMSGIDTMDVHSGGVITVTDHGEGMSPEFMTEKFTKLGKSTKDQDANAMGGFGIGSKSVLSLTDYATWRTVKDGMVTVLVMSQDQNGITINHESFPAENEENGTTVTLPVNGSVMKYVLDHIQQEFLDYVSSERVVIVSDDVSLSVGNTVDNVTYTADNGIQFLPVVDQSSMYRNYANLHLMVNGAPYPVPNSINHRFINRSDAPWKSHFTNQSMNIDTGDIIVNLDQNHPDVIILPSREALVESDGLDRLITQKVDGAVEEIVKNQTSVLSSSSSMSEWMDNLKDFTESNLFNISVNYAFYLRQSAMSLFKGSTNRVFYGAREFSIFDVNADKNVKLAEVKKNNGKVLTGNHDINLTRFTILDHHEAWKRTLNQMAKITNARAMGDELINADNISDIVPDENIGYLLDNETKSEHQHILRYMLDSGFAPGFVTLDSIYEIMGVEFSDLTATDVRKNLMTRVRSKSREGGTTTKVDTPITVYKYVDGEGMVEVATPETVPALGRWIEENRNEISGRFLCYPEAENGVDQDSDIFFAKSADELKEMMRSADFSEMMIVRSVKARLGDHYHVRVYNEVRQKASHFKVADFPQRNQRGNEDRRGWGWMSHSDNWYDTRDRDNIIATVASYFSDDEVNKRLSLKKVASDLHTTTAEVMNMVDALSELSAITINGRPVVNTLKENFEVIDSFDTLADSVTIEDYRDLNDCVAVHEVIRSLTSRKVELFKDQGQVTSTLYALSDIREFLRLEENGLDKVLPVFMDMTGILRDIETEDFPEAIAS